LRPLDSCLTGLVLLFLFLLSSFLFSFTKKRWNLHACCQRYCYCGCFRESQ
jgi:hypothetical protein